MLASALRVCLSGNRARQTIFSHVPVSENLRQPPPVLPLYLREGHESGFGTELGLYNSHDLLFNIIL